MSVAETILATGAPRNVEGVSVPWFRHKDGTAVLVHYYRRPDRKNPAKTIGTNTQQKTCIPFEDTRRVALAFAQWLQQIQGSLTARSFHDLIEHYKGSHADARGLDSYLNGLDVAIGNCRLDGRFAERWAIFLSKLRAEPYRAKSWSQTSARQRSPATIAKYMAVCRTVLRYAYNTGVLDNMPVRQWELPAAPARTRVLSPDEESRLLRALENDWLYWPVVFALHNPIRVGDLFNLTWENVDLTVPWVRFWPAKTGGTQGRATCLVCLDEEMLDYLSRPHGAELLFPRWHNGAGVHPGDFKRHWTTVCESAGIRGFLFHDLRHCATKYMLDQGYTTDELLRLEIHGTAERVRRYDTADQRELARKRSGFVATMKQANG